MFHTSIMTFTRGFIFMLVFLDSTYGQATLTTSPRDDIYQNITPVCQLQELCKDRTHVNFTQTAFQCQCDKMCSFYDNCCRDSPFFTPSDKPKSNFTCVDLPVAFEGNIQIKMIAHCPLYADAEKRRLCEKPDGAFLLGRVPITVADKNISVIYSSVYCARCNAIPGPNATYYLWNTTLVCTGHASGKKNFSDDAEASWDPKNNRFNYTEGNVTLNCVPKVNRPIESALPIAHVRCPKVSYVHQCPEDWPNATDARLCKGYTAQVKRSGKLYKNQYCVKCHLGDHNNISCITNEVKFITTRIGGSSPADYSKYSIILRYVRSECGHGEHYDAILKECVHLFPPRAVHHEREADPIDTCVRVIVPANLFTMSPDNITAIVPKYERNFSQGHFRLSENGKLEICGEDAPQQAASIMTLVISIVTLVGLSLSIVFLFLHLCAVVLVPQLRNLSGLALASLCLALLGAYTSFIIGSILREKSFHWCYRSAIATYVFFMTSFFWMLVLAFDVSKVVRLSVRKFRSSRGFKWRRFTVYSIVAWGIPTVLGIAAHLVDQAAPGSVDDRFRPGFALDGCWFSRSNSLLVFFLIPLAVIMVLNVSFFLYATVMTSENSTSRRKNLRVYVKLTVLLGLNWIVGLLASMLDSDLLWLIFALLNTLQGLFVFLSFTITPKVSTGLFKHVPYFRKPSKQVSPGRANKETSLDTKTGSI